MEQIRPLYKSFWMGGFEGADHVNANKVQLDMVKASGHSECADDNYRKLAELGIKTVRESIGWRVSRPTLNSPLDLSRALRFAEVAERHDIQIIWTFMHYGAPEGVNLFHDSFIDHFVEYAVKVAEALKGHDSTPIFNLINEISFLSWAVSQTNFIWPYVGSGNNREGFEVKCRLVRAVLEAMVAVRTVSPSARFLHIEPLLHIVAPANQPELKELALEVRDHQWQTWELLRGAMEPQLGGYPEALDLMGVNYYHNGQMEVVTGNYLDWATQDPRRALLSDLLKEVQVRYGRPFIIAETGHFDDNRARWLDYVLCEAKKALAAGVPLQGLCIYPVIDRPCWHEPTKIINCGIMEHAKSIEALQYWQKAFT